MNKDTNLYLGAPSDKNSNKDAQEKNITAIRDAQAPRTQCHVTEHILCTVSGNILGLGIDLCNGRRLEKTVRRHGQRALDRLFTPAEQDYAKKYSKKYSKEYIKGYSKDNTKGEAKDDIMDDAREGFMGPVPGLPFMVYAKRFAAKEATFKAIGTGIGTHFSWTDIEIGHEDSGAPVLKLSPTLQRHLFQRYQGAFKTFVSLTDDKPWAQAIVIFTRP